MEKETKIVSLVECGSVVLFLLSYAVYMRWDQILTRQTLEVD